MTCWTIDKNYHSHGALAVYERDGVPVLIARVGTYPSATADDGRSTRDEPHVLISVGSRQTGEIRAYHGVTVTAMGAWHCGRRRALTVYDDQHYGGDESRLDREPDRWIAAGEAKIPEAIEVLRRLDDQYAAAAAFGARLNGYPTALSRQAYEAACAEFGVEALPDADCGGYWVEYGQFSWPEYSLEKCAFFELARRRARQIATEIAATQAQQHPGREPSPRVVPREGQLWEECERCGAEPVYMPLHLCDRCWPEVA